MPGRLTEQWQASELGRRMKRPKEKAKEPIRGEAPSHRVRLPGFLVEEDIGLGDVIKRVTYAMGVKPCAWL